MGGEDNRHYLFFLCKFNNPIWEEVNNRTTLRSYLYIIDYQEPFLMPEYNESNQGLLTNLVRISTTTLSHISKKSRR